MTISNSHELCKLVNFENKSGLTTARLLMLCSYLQTNEVSFETHALGRCTAYTDWAGFKL